MFKVSIYWIIKNQEHSTSYHTLCGSLYLGKRVILKQWLHLKITCQSMQMTERLAIKWHVSKVTDFLWTTNFSLIFYATFLKRYTTRLKKIGKRGESFYQTHYCYVYKELGDKHNISTRGAIDWFMLVFIHKVVRIPQTILGILQFMLLLKISKLIMI
jgi:hypothetical protein